MRKSPNEKGCDFEKEKDSQVPMGKDSHLEQERGSPKEKGFSQ